MTADEPSGVGVDATSMSATEQAGIMIREEYWLLWADVAIREALASASANATVTSQSAADEDRVAAMWLELRSGTQSICAAAFSVEALCYLISTDVVKPATLAAWQQPRGWPGGMAVMHRTLQDALNVPAIVNKKLRIDFEAVIRNRNEAVHYDVGFEEAVPVPAGGLGSPAYDRFGAAKAQVAVNAMRAVYQALLDHAVPALRPFTDANRATLSGVAQGKPHELQ